MIQLDQFDRMADDLADGLNGRRAQNAVIARQEDALADLLDVAQRLVADHQRVSPHHASLCGLCRDAEVAISRAKQIK